MTHRAEVRIDRQTLHLERRQPHVTHYTLLHWIESEVIFWTVASVVYCRFSVWRLCFVASLPISVNISTTCLHKNPLYVLVLLPPTLIHFFVSHTGEFSTKLYYYYLVKTLKCVEDVQGPTKASQHPGGYLQVLYPWFNAIGRSDKAESQKCWVIFQN